MPGDPPGPGARGTQITGVYVMPSCAHNAPRPLLSLPVVQAPGTGIDAMLQSFGVPPMRGSSASNLQILSVDACQGDEADAVVVSTVRTSKQLSRWAGPGGPGGDAAAKLDSQPLMPRPYAPSTSNTLAPPWRSYGPQPWAWMCAQSAGCKDAAHLPPRSFFRDRQRINVALSRAGHLCVVLGHRSVLSLPRAQPWGRVLASYSDAA